MSAQQAKLYIIFHVFVKEVDAIIDKQGGTVSAEIHGYIGKLIVISLFNQ